MDSKSTLFLMTSMRELPAEVGGVTMIYVCVK